MAKPSVDSLILTIRGHKVMLDVDLAKLYGVRTKALNQAVKRNEDRFPEDFRFQLSQAESVELKSQVAAPGSQGTDPKDVISNRSQIVTGSQKHRDPRVRPWMFTEHGAIMSTAKIKRLRAAAWKTGSAGDFQQLSNDEAMLVELKVMLSDANKRSRQKHGLSQIELARKIGASQSRIAKIEAGVSPYRANPRLPW